MTRKRHDVQITKEYLDLLDKIVEIRPELKGFNTSKRVHVILLDGIRQNLKKESENTGLHNAPMV